MSEPRPKLLLVELRLPLRKLFVQKVLRRVRVVPLLVRDANRRRRLLLAVAKALARHVRDHLAVVQRRVAIHLDRVEASLALLRRRRVHLRVEGALRGLELAKLVAVELDCDLGVDGEE